MHARDCVDQLDLQHQPLLCEWGCQAFENDPGRTHFWEEYEFTLNFFGEHHTVLWISLGVWMSCSAFKAAVTKENIPSEQRGIAVNSDIALGIQNVLVWLFEIWSKQTRLCLRECVPPPYGGGTHPQSSLLDLACMPTCPSMNCVLLWGNCRLEAITL